MIGIPLGLAYGNAVEWILHRYLLHGLGKKKKTFFSFHWSEHHKNARQNNMYDPDYAKPFLKSGPPFKETVSLVLFGLLHLPLLPIAPFFTLTGYYCIFNYLRVHKKAHQDVEWAKQNLPWHRDHHMGKNQDANWCVTKPWFDVVMGTRQAEGRA